MQVNDLTPERLRELAEVRPPHGRVLSLYLDLNPTDFGTGANKGAAVRSLLDEADRRVREADGDLDHDDKAALRADLDRAREFLEGDLPTKGVHGLALFASGPSGLFEAIRLPRSVESTVAIDQRPHIEPLAELGHRGSWLVALVNQRTTRVLRGSGDQLAEIGRFTSAEHAQHDQGQQQHTHHARDLTEQAYEHLRHTADVLFRHHKRTPFDHLLIGATAELYPEIEERLHSYLRDRLAGRIDVDVEDSRADDVAATVAPLVERHETKREREALDRMLQGVGGGGRGAAGLDEVLSALFEQRVEILLVDEGFRAPGVVCPSCGWMGVDAARCPLDDSEVERRDDVVEPAMEATLRQSAEVLAIRHHPDLGQHGSIGAVLRY